MTAGEGGARSDVGYCPATELTRCVSPEADSRTVGPWTSSQCGDTSCVPTANVGNARRGRSGCADSGRPEDDARHRPSRLRRPYDDGAVREARSETDLTT